MALKTFKPTTPGLRQLSIVDRSGLHKGKPFKALTVGKSEKGGRNNAGRITVRFRGGGHKQSYRIVDFKRRKLDMAAKVERLEYDPNRTSLHCARQICRRRIRLYHRPAAPRGRRRGGRWRSGRREAGQCDAAREHPVGTIVHNVEMKIGKGGAIARSAGTYAQIVGRDQGYVSLRAQFGRAAADPRPMLRLDRRGVEPGPHERLARQGRPQPLARSSPPQSRRHDEPGRPSARRPAKAAPRGGRHPVSPWASRPRQEDPQQQVHRQVHRRNATRSQEERLSR